MKMRYLFIILVFCLFLIPGVSAAQPPIFFVGYDKGVEIAYPQIDFLKQNRDYTFHFHTYNKSNGYPIFNDTINCSFHLYNSSGGHMITKNDLVNNYEGYDWEYLVLGGNFSVINDYTYIFGCNNSLSSETLLGGFVKVKFEVTKSGTARISSGEGTMLAVIISIITLLGVLFWIWGMKIETDKLPSKVMCFAMSMVMFVIIILYSIVILEEVLGRYVEIIAGFSTFYIVMQVIVSAAVLALVLYGMYCVSQIWRMHRGLMD